MLTFGPKLLSQGHLIQHVRYSSHMTSIVANSDLTLRAAVDADAQNIAAIFAHYVTSTTVTFELEPPTVQDWRDKVRESQSVGWPFVVGMVGGQVVGYAYVGPWRLKPAYRHTVEDSVYLAPGHTGRGYGRGLLAELLARATGAGARQVIAVIADTGHPASVRLHQRAGFEQAGLLRQVGFKHGRWIDTLLLQRDLTAEPAGPRSPRAAS